MDVEYRNALMRILLVVAYQDQSSDPGMPLQVEFSLARFSLAGIWSSQLITHGVIIYNSMEIITPWLFQFTIHIHIQNAQTVKARILCVVDLMFLFGKKLIKFT